MKAPVYLIVLPLLGLMLGACQPPANHQYPPLTTTTIAAPRPSVSADELWQALLERTPVPWTTPLPPEQVTILDSTYVKIDPRLATPFPCRRCPDYAMEGGLWKLQLSQGVFRIYYTVNGWRSLGSYSVSGNTLFLYNDPYCQWDTGEYSWTLENGALTLIEIRDPCSQGLRAANLTHQAWLSCQPPNIEARVSDHWQKPQGCDPADPGE